jgi:hypothetical protein
MPQIGEIASGVRETSKLGGTRLIWLFPIGVFTLFNCALVTTQDISIVRVPQIGEIANGIQEISKLGGTPLISWFPIGVFT